MDITEATTHLEGPAALVGRTPLVRLRRFEPVRGVEIYAKLESRNPGGSVKDRAALAMILDGERTGALRRGRTLIDATSGNTGISYAMLGASRGIPVRLCVPANVTPERKGLLTIYGAELILTDPMEGSDGAIREARRIYAANPARYFYPNQYDNPANWRAHYDTTGVEILEQTEGEITHFVAGLGTSGTFTGTARRLRAAQPHVHLVSVQPDSPLHGLEGLKHMASAIVPGIYDPTLADENVSVTTEDAHAMVRRLARDEGLLAGPSSGAALHAAIELARTIDRGVIVTIFPDGGDRYLTEHFWNGPPSARIDARTLDVIREHAIRTYPEECCGALLGPRAGDIQAAHPLMNTVSDERVRRFLVSPSQYRAAEKHAADLGFDLVGFYHSHPDHPAVPSAFDLEHAWPNLHYVIAASRQGAVDDIRSWRLNDDRSAFDEEILRD